MGAKHTTPGGVNGVGRQGVEGQRDAEVMVGRKSPDPGSSQQPMVLELVRGPGWVRLARDGETGRGRDRPVSCGARAKNKGAEHRVDLPCLW